MPKKRSDREYGPFEGDGRHKVKPIEPLEGTRPVAITKSMARMLIDHFVEKGESFHSDMGAVTWVIVAWCVAQSVSHEVIKQTIDGVIVGYQIKRI